jgi:transcriptional regulator with XRE-family HTH domain
MTYTDPFPERLRNLMDVKRITQEDLAREVGVSRMTIYKWTVGRSGPKLDQLIALTAVFHVSADYLIGRADAPAIGMADVQRLTGLSGVALENLKRWRLDPKRKHLVRAIETILSQ